ncbi:MAG: hypothetical protein COW00_14280 [Bdellovibrio sp. CG12_big_fil_rev_8_21_14_0_65_39_13]|nr:MAG: hypothetical protein COW78_07975 [Bdellovibrio sp. CG22_combo_CG10-13_8_21_14_all_39_27]PIQ58780.1 MAG: hypothetical protein COW00_14280 [Bdellovibrio sp. CG12_big_fil_rev_8_21_14_0_65_39_13]PIR35539.1 MAG: hypothetical protein COV37_08680 [Bdellovibrio sp. CG11_big_fil_rev_8_21_14_0_20_39_38]
MFESKYIFEGKETRMWRKTKNFLLISLFLFLGFISLGLIIVRVGSNETALAREYFYNRHPDLVVVYTGDNGRIPLAFQLAKQYRQARILISGVYNKNNVETLVNPLQDQTGLDPNLLEIDYLARNTVENVLSTLRYLRVNKGFNNILVVSSDYHIFRIKLIMNRLRSEKEGFQVFYSGVENKFDDLRNVTILYKEVYKSIKALLFLTFWDPELETIKD